MKNIQKNTSTVGPQNYKLIEKAENKIFIYDGSGYLSSTSISTDSVTVTGNVTIETNKDSYSTLWQIVGANNEYKLKNLNADLYCFIDGDNLRLTEFDNAAVFSIQNNSIKDTNTNKYINSSAQMSQSNNSNWEIQEVAEVNVTVSSALWATLHLPFPVFIPEETLVYIGKENTENSVKLTKILEFLPAWTPAIINAPSGTYVFRIAYNKMDKPPISPNLFLGTGLRLTDLAPQSFYVLANPTYKDGFTVEGAGFYLGSDAVTSIPANKTYMLRDETTTGGTFQP